MTNNVNRLAIAAVLMAGAPALAQTSASTEVPAWVNKFSLGGDFLTRLQSVNDESKSPNENSGEVFRLRLGLTAKVNEQITVNTRLASGNTTNTITSSNQTVTNQNAKKPIWIDIASLDYKPVDFLVVTAGKAVNPFFTAGKNEMIWDADVTYEGYNVKYSQTFGEFTPFATVGHSILSETNNTADVTMFGAQLGTAYKSESFGATVAVSSYTYNGVMGQTAATFGLGNQGNSLSGTGFQFDYKLTNVEAEVTTDALGIPVTAYGAWVQNSDPSEFNQGTTGGLRLGRVKDVGSWSLDYFYRDLQKDATLGTFSDGDFAGGGTDGRGHRIAAQYVVAAGTTVQASAFYNKRSVSTANTNYEKYLLVLATAF